MKDDMNPYSVVTLVNYPSVSPNRAPGPSPLGFDLWALCY